MRPLTLRESILFTCVLSILMMIFACGPKARTSTSQMDTPEHHTVTGLTLLGESKYGEAEREFALAVELAPDYSQAHTGIALAKAYTGDFNASSESLKSGWKYAKTKDEKVLVHVARIRLFTLGKLDKNWLKQAKDEYDDALKLDHNCAAAHYFLGLSYKTALEFDLAGQMFKNALGLNKEYVKEADAEWKLTQKIQRAMPGTMTGKKIALLERINRADAAAVFMEELKIDNLFKKRTIKTFDTSFKDPEKAKSKDKSMMPKDIAEHALRADIEGILAIGVRGLETYPDGLFHPHEFVDRAMYAMMIEDVLIKVTGDNALATKFIGQVSPFPDLRSDLPYFNAVMVATSRGLMEPTDFTSGEFSPLRPVAGVDALLIIRKFKEELKFF